MSLMLLCASSKKCINDVKERNETFLKMCPKPKIVGMYRYVRKCGQQKKIRVMVSHGHRICLSLSKWYTPKNVWSYRISAFQHLRKNLLEQCLCRMWWYYLSLDYGLGQHVCNNSSIIFNCGEMEYIHRSHQKVEE